MPVRRQPRGVPPADAAEDAAYGRGRRGDELPAELARRETRLARIRAAKTTPITCGSWGELGRLEP